MQYLYKAQKDTKHNSAGKVTLVQQDLTPSCAKYTRHFITATSVFYL